MKTSFFDTSFSDALNTHSSIRVDPKKINAMVEILELPESEMVFFTMDPFVNPHAIRFTTILNILKLYCFFSYNSGERMDVAFLKCISILFPDAPEDLEFAFLGYTNISMDSL